jgi:hypothetical protein
VTLLAGLTSVTVTSGRTAPLISLTVPEIEPAPVCPNAPTSSNSTADRATNNPSSFLLRAIAVSPIASRLGDTLWPELMRGFYY